MDIVCQLLDRRSHLVENLPYLVNSDDTDMCCLQWYILLEVYWTTQVVLVDAGCTAYFRAFTFDAYNNLRWRHNSNSDN